jgi:hypothetical protein
MAKTDFLKYLEEKIDNNNSDYDFALSWDKKNKRVELSARIFAENKVHLTIDDEFDTESSEEVIEFVDTVVFYDETKEKAPEDCLAAIPYDGKKGVTRAQLDAVMTTLVETLDDGQSDLLDFVSDQDFVNNQDFVRNQEELAKLSQMTDSEMFESLQAMDGEERARLLDLMDGELTFSLHWNEENFAKQVEENLIEENGQEMLPYPKF